ncbi:MATE family efflux transporter [uncultured Sphaerochaeta sp.]|uniref:MATE family efflux transporter n=1 Tax=uncultured Sphaerochaeta sp. TaxID=886478 RepID=UPI002A0A29E2|nr:MATE family efflux transporter [uncultured Sphaerochaeta sp.]
MGMLILQNMVSYSVNLADNIMLGSYSQFALSGAAIVNQIQFLLQQVTLGIGEGLVVLASQYWGEKKLEPINELIGIALYVGIFIGTILFFFVSFMPKRVLSIFSDDPDILETGSVYISLIKYTYILFIITNILEASLRSVETVKIAFKISIISLVVNVIINYILIFGSFGAPELGIKGAAIGTLIARCLEFAIIVYYVVFVDGKLHLRISQILKPRFTLVKDFFRISLPVVATQFFFGLSVGLQAAILGHLSADAIAANSAASTLFQYFKLMAIGASSASSVLIAKSVGSGKIEKIKEYSRTFQIIYILIGVLISALLLVVRIPFLSLYSLTPDARILANQIIIILSFTCVGTAYQMPTLTGIVRGGGDTKFVLKNDLICIWLIMYPISFLVAFYWKLPIYIVVIFLNSDQVFKCIPASIKVNKYNWINKLTK